MKVLMREQIYNILATFSTSGREQTLKNVNRMFPEYHDEATEILDLYIKFKDNKEFPGSGNGYIDVAAYKKTCLTYLTDLQASSKTLGEF